MSDYSKAQRIKQRITKYATDNNQVALKYLFAYVGPRSTSTTTQLQPHANQASRAAATASNATWSATTRRKTSLEIKYPTPSIASSNPRGRGRCLPFRSGSRMGIRWREKIPSLRPSPRRGGPLPCVPGFDLLNIQVLILPLISTAVIPHHLNYSNTLLFQLQ